MTALAALREELNAKQKALHDIFEAHPDLDMSEETVSNIQQKNAELNDLTQKYEKARELDLIRNGAREAVKAQNEGGDRFPVATQPATESPVRGKSLGTLMGESEEYKAALPRSKPHFSMGAKGVSLKTLMTTTAGFPPESTRSGLVIWSALRRPVVASLIPQDDIDQPAVIYMEETTFTNNAAPVAEGDPKPESALAFTQRTVPLEVIATWLPITRQQLDDVVQIRAVVDNRLTFMLLLAEETQLLTGTGTSPQLQGFLTKTGVQTQAVGADPVPDACYKAMTKVRFTGFAEPSGFVMHPNDWQDIRLLRTADGVYIWGPPSEEGPERMWGLPVIPTPAETENTILTGDFQLYSHISRKMGIEIDVSDSHGTYFVENKLAIRIEERLSLEIYRAAAFCKVTGA
jgi:HK97 family phage major capsid protein